jgi:single-strand DNA-binding protein
VGGEQEADMYETQATVIGNVATAVKGWKLPNGDAVAKFRVANTARRRGPSGEWVDGDTLFVSVTCWRQLAENVIDSIGVGDPVMVRGRLYTDDYEWEGKRRTEIKMEGYAVAPDLNRCRVVLTRTRRSGAAPEAVGVDEGSGRSGAHGGEAVGASSGGGRTVVLGGSEELDAVQEPSDDQRERLGAPVEAGVGG